MDVHQLPHPTDVVVVSPDAILGLDMLCTYNRGREVHDADGDTSLHWNVSKPPSPSPPSCADGVRVVSHVDHRPVWVV